MAAMVVSFLSLILMLAVAATATAKFDDESDKFVRKIMLPTETLDTENTDSQDELKDGAAPRKLQSNEWRFEVDCTADFLISGNGDNANTLASTGDDVVAVFYNVLGETISTDTASGVGPCTDDAFESDWRISTTQDVEGVTLRATGTNALFIEQARLLFCNPDCVTVEEWLNANDETGICLSTDDEVGGLITNSNEDFFIDGRCFTEYCFRVDETTVNDGDCVDQISSAETVTSQQFGFDCFVPGLANLQTRFNIAVHFHDIDDNVIESVIFPSGFNPCVDDAVFTIDIDTDIRVRNVRMVATNTDPDDVKFDALFIDFAFLNVDNVQVNTWDADGSLGYCLSTEIGDVINSGWENNARENFCSSSICFNQGNIIDTGCSRGNEVNVNVDNEIFVVDCFFPDGVALGTTDVVTLEFYDRDGDLIQANSRTDIECTEANPEFSVSLGSNAQRVVTIEMEISGDNALFIDNAYLQIDGVKERVFDESGTVGWCLSTDQDDAVADDWLLYTGENGCASRLCFGRDVVRSTDDCTTT